MDPSDNRGDQQQSNQHSKSAAGHKTRVTPEATLNKCTSTFRASLLCCFEKLDTLLVQSPKFSQRYGTHGPAHTHTNKSLTNTYLPSRARPGKLAALPCCLERDSQFRLVASYTQSYPFGHNPKPVYCKISDAAALVSTAASSKRQDREAYGSPYLRQQLKNLSRRDITTALVLRCPKAHS